MGLPRSQYVKEGQEGVYHCFSRCVRRASLCGFDKLTLRDFSHRKACLVDRLRFLAAIFAIDVCAYAVMENHYHTVLRTRPDIVDLWTDREVANRWLTLFPRQRKLRGTTSPPIEQEICALADCPERIKQLRRRLSSLSWFMGRLNEFIARAANKEDGVKGRFWESRFKCQALLDEAAIAACMVYVDLNPIRAGLAATPESSSFTSIQERIRAWQKETIETISVPRDAEQDLPSLPLSRGTPIPEITTEISDALPALWLCPIQSDSDRRGVLQMTSVHYFELVDRSGRMTRSHQRGTIDPELAPILLRIGANPEAWLETISHFGSQFRLAAGVLSNLRGFGSRLGRRWLQGIMSARAAFPSSQPQMA